MFKILVHGCHGCQYTLFVDCLRPLETIPLAGTSVSASAPAASARRIPQEHSNCKRGWEAEGPSDNNSGSWLTSERGIPSNKLPYTSKPWKFLGFVSKPRFDGQWKVKPGFTPENENPFFGQNPRFTHDFPHFLRM
jgi:hypothetical protein